MILLIISYLLIGALAGFLAGLLGVGGGIIVVPALAFIFNHYFDPRYVMHMAVATSLAAMIFTVSRAYLSHMKSGVQFWAICRSLMPGLAIGVIVGAIAAHFLQSKALTLLFGLFLIVIALKMIFEKEHLAKDRQLPHSGVMFLAALTGGTLSGLLGIGGGTLTIPFLIHYGISMRQAVMVSIVAGIMVSIIGSVSFIISGEHVTGLPPHSWGYVYWPALLFVSIGSVLLSPLGAWLSRRISNTWLKRIFAFFVSLVAIHMLWGL